MQEITDIVDRLYPIDDTCNLDEYGYFTGWKNREKRAKKDYVIGLFFNLNGINRWLKGDLEPLKYATDEEVQKKKGERQRLYGELCKELDFVADEEERPHGHEDVIIPDELNTDEAKKWLQVAIDGGLLNGDYSTTDKTKTKPQKALLAETLSEKIRLKHKYKPFETIWGVSGLAKARYKSREETGTVKGGDIITDTFKDK